MAESLSAGQRAMPDAAGLRSVGANGPIAAALSQAPAGTLIADDVADGGPITFRVFDNDGDATPDVEVAGASSGNGVYEDINTLVGSLLSLGDTLFVDIDADAVWAVTGVDAGFLSIAGFGVIAFSRIENLTGAAGNRDVFAFEEDGRISGLVNGGSGGVDGIALSGITPVTVTYASSGPGSGTIGRGADVITYADLEPIVDALGGPKVFANTSAGVDAITLTDIGAPGDNAFIVQNAAAGQEDVTFTNASAITSLTINADGGDDTITINVLDSLFVGDVIVNGGGGADRFTVNAVTGTGDYTLNGEADDDVFEPRVLSPGVVPTLILNGGADNDSFLYAGDADFRLSVAHFGETVLHPLFAISMTDTIERAVVVGRSLDATGYLGSAVLVDVSAVPSWQAQGPGQIVTTDPNRQDAPYPQVGAVQAIAIHPFDDRVIFAGTVNGGVHRSVDGGASWTALTDQFPSLAIGALAINSHDVDGNPVTANYMGTGQPTPWQKLVVYAGTGQFSNNFDGGFAVGVLKSTTGGDSWILLTSAELAGLPVTSIAAKRVGGDDVVLVATSGTSKFEEVSAYTDGVDLTFANANPDTITRSSGSWVDDGFKVNQTIRVSGTPRNDGRYVISAVSPLVLTLSPTDILAAEVVAAAAGASVSDDGQAERILIKTGGIFRSTNGGGSFTKIEPVTASLGVIPRGDKFPAGSVTDLVADPYTGADRFYAAVIGGGVYVSNDAGASWTAVNNNLTLAGDGLDNDGNGVPDDAGEAAAGAMRIRLTVQANPASATNAVFASLIGHGEWFMGVFRSADQGANWALVSQAAPSPSASMFIPRSSTEMELFAGSNTIVRTTGNWIKDGFLLNQLINISGATIAANNATFTIIGITPSTITVNGPLAADPKGSNFTVRGYPPLTFNDLANDTITRGGVGSFTADGFMPGQIIGSLPILAVTPNTLTLGASLPAGLLGTTTTGPFSIEAEADVTAAIAPQVNLGTQGERNSAIVADAAGNLYIVGDRPPHLYRWDAVATTWAEAINDNANGTRPHADGRTLVLDARGNLLSGDDGGVYRLVNRNVTPLANMTGDPALEAIRFDQKAGADTIERLTHAGAAGPGSWLADGFRPGMVIRVMNSSGGNDGSYTIDTVDATTITLIASDTLNDAFFVDNDLRITADPSVTINPGSAYSAAGPTLTFADVNPDTITRSGARTWAMDGFAVNQTIFVSGTASNDGVYTIAAISPDGLTLTLAGADALQAEAGIFSVTAQRLWQSLNNGLGVTEVLSASYDPLNNVIFVGTQDNGVSEQPRPLDGVDNDGDGVIDEDDERLRFEEVVVAFRPGDGNTNAVVSIDSDGNGTLDQTLRITMSNDIETLGSRLFGADGRPIAGTDNLILLRGDATQTFSFVVPNAANDRLRIPGHGLATGDGPFWVDARPGPGPAGDPELPQGLQSWRQYWVIVDNANEIRLATSRANATRTDGLGNPDPIAVDITDDGAGTRILSRRFTGLGSYDAETFRNGFYEIEYVVNAVDSTRMAIGLTSVYVSKNIGTAAMPAYDRLDTVERVDALQINGNGQISGLVYGHPDNPDLVYAASGNQVGIVVPNLYVGELTFAVGSGSGDSITRTDGGDWASDGFDAGQQIFVVGAGANDGDYFIDAILSATELRITDDGVLSAGTVADVHLHMATTESINNVIEITDLVVDPDDWQTAYATTGTGVYKRTGTDQWELISQKLYNFNLDSIALVKSTSGDVLLVGGVTGVSRALDPAPGVAWTEFGTGLPNALVRDIDFIARDPDLENPDLLDRGDILLAATLGRGVWTVNDADVSLAEEAVLRIEGGSGNDTIVIERRSSNASLIDIYVNASSAPTFSMPLQSVLKIEILGNDGDDTVTVDSSNGPIVVPQGVHFDGGIGTNALILEGGKVEAYERTDVAGTVTYQITDTGSDVAQTVVITNASDTNNLTEPSLFERIGAALVRFFRWLAFWTDDPTPQGGAETELALIGGSLPKALNGTSKDPSSPASDPVSGAQQVVQNGGITEQAGLQRLIEQGDGAFSLTEIGASIVTATDLAARLDALDAIGGNVTFDDVTSATDDPDRQDAPRQGRLRPLDHVVRWRDRLERFRWPRRRGRARPRGRLRDYQWPVFHRRLWAGCHGAQSCALDGHRGRRAVRLPRRQCSQPDDHHRPAPRNQFRPAGPGRRRRHPPGRTDAEPARPCASRRPCHLRDRRRCGGRPRLRKRSGGAGAAARRGGAVQPGRCVVHRDLGRHHADRRRRHRV
ncbi:MAG: hypothetical protein AMJ58_12585 [Gammaproteobacteria bacterium SG8_30]|nr:MAG: hypothetical protein AMJ58_12585 [Gammaproteobacteria bacterium SG8_30]